MEACWRREPGHRPPFANVVRSLEVIVADLEARTSLETESGAQG